MLIAEKLVLVALDPDGRRARVGTDTHVGVGITGALVAELALEGHLDLTDGRIHVTGTRPDHPVLVRALDETARFDGRKLADRLPRIRHAGWSEVVEHLIADGALGEEHVALRPTRHPVLRTDVQAAVLAELRGAIAAGGPFDPRLAVLLGLIGPTHQLEVIAPDRADRARARAAIDAAATNVDAVDAVKRAITAVEAAVTAALVATVVVTG